MRGRAVRPRHDQVAELTRGVRLPLSPLADEHLEVLADGLRQAFDDIRTYAPDTVAAGDEREVNALMHARLNSLLADECSLWRQLVLCVGRGTESISFDGSHLENRPDLSIVLSGVGQRFPLVAEAKIIDAKKSKTVALYCEKGIRRFVEGEYAWSSREAFMIGYVRDGSSINPALTDVLLRAAALDPGRYLVQTLPTPVGSGSSDLAYTQHDRNFVYGSPLPPNRPGPISVWHLWLT